MADLKEKTLALRRDHILQAAIRVFAERGFQRASMKQIAREAGVAEGTIYNVYENKADLLVGVLGRLSDRSSSGAIPDRGLAGGVTERLSIFDGDTLNMTRVVLAESLVNPVVRKTFSDTVVAPMLAGTTPSQYLAVAVTAGAVLLRLLEQSDPDVEAGAIELLELIERTDRRSAS